MVADVAASTPQGSGQDSVPGKEGVGIIHNGPAPQILRYMLSCA